MRKQEIKTIGKELVKCLTCGRTIQFDLSDEDKVEQITEHSYVVYCDNCDEGTYFYK